MDELLPKERFPRKTDEQLKTDLTQLQYYVTQLSATERPFQNEYEKEFRRGIYVDITTGEPLFASADKYESGCGWPAFSRPIKNELLAELDDFSIENRPRTEVRSKNGDAHLGHVFTDGPEERGGLRYCINSAALRFISYEDMAEAGYADYLSMVE